MLLFLLVSCGLSESNKTAINLISNQNIVPTSTTEKEYDFIFIDSSFQTFYERFTTDSTFQMSRIKFPLEGQYQSYDEERIWTKKEWNLMTWDFRVDINTTEDSISIIQDNSQFFYGVYCLDCGFSFEMQFKKINARWLLTYRQEYNY